MSLSAVSLNTLRAFEAAARHLSFTRAAEELCVTQTAVSHQVKALEAHLGVALFRRTSRGLALTDEGAALFPVMNRSFAEIARTIAAITGETPQEILNVGVVGTFAVGFLIERLAQFRVHHPGLDVRLSTNNNKVDLWTDNLDCAIRYGDGNWHGVHSTLLMRAPLAPLCLPTVAINLSAPDDLARVTLLRSYRTQDWPLWFEAAGSPPLTAKGAVFDASYLMVQAAMLSGAVAIAPPSMFRRELLSGMLVQPFATTVDAGGYWLTCLSSKAPPPGFKEFGAWLSAACGEGGVPFS